MKKKYFYLTGASGVGKSTILNYFKNQPSANLQSLEVSARPYLPQNGSYDQTLTDEIQALIVQHRTLSSLEVFLKGQPTVFSRGAIDNLAYQRTLQKGMFLDSCSRREIEIIRDNQECEFLYVPVEFPMSQDDILRGNNTSIQLATDKAIIDIFQEFSIFPLIVKGSISERETILYNYFTKEGYDLLPF